MLEQRPQETTTETAAPLSRAQLALPEFAMDGERALPTKLYQERFTFENSANTEVTCAQRALNWLTAFGQDPLIISGPQGIGKSILSWQIMSEADGRGLVPVMVDASSLVMNNDHIVDRALAMPVSPLKDLVSLLHRVEANQLGPHSDIGKSVVLIIDGADTSNYNPRQHPECFQMMRRIHDAGINVILNVDSDRSAITGGSLDGYQAFFNPDKRATTGLKLTYDREGERILKREDITRNH